MISLEGRESAPIRIHRQLHRGDLAAADSLSSNSRSRTRRSLHASTALTGLQLIQTSAGAGQLLILFSASTSIPQLLYQHFTPNHFDLCASSRVELGVVHLHAPHWRC